MWTIIILVLFVVAGVAALAFALRARPAHRKDANLDSGGSAAAGYGPDVGCDAGGAGD